MSSVNGLPGSNDSGIASARRVAQSLRDPELHALLEAEFPAADDPGGVSRRRWLQVMGASLMLGAAGGCRWKKEEILPLASQPPRRLPGEFQRFATARDIAGSALGLRVTSVDGRPIKIEGNPRHPQSLGATDAWTQASILELYDPDRSGSVLQRTGAEAMEQTWPKFLEFLRPQLAAIGKTQGAGLAVLSEASSSPTLAALRDRLLKAYPQAKWHEYEPLSHDNEREGARLAFGEPVRTHLALEKARVIVCLDADPLGVHPAAVRYARDFAKGRDPEAGPMNRLYVVEPCPTITGSVADHRLALRCGEVAWFARALHAAVVQGLGSKAEAATESGPDESPTAFVRAVAKDLKTHGAHVVVIAGPRQAPEVHALVHEINAALGSVGHVVAYTADPEPNRPRHVAAISSLVADMQAGKVQMLVMLGGNPVYDAPADLRFAEAMTKVPARLHLSPYDNETSLLCSWHLPRSHYLESWGDARGYDGTYSIIQPLIAPLHDSRTALELLALLAGEEKATGYDLVRVTFKELAGPEWETKWGSCLESGLLAGSAWPAASPRLVRETPPGDPGPQPGDGLPGPEQTEIVFCPGSGVYDGRFANNAWLQEMPDPMTKLTWDNAAWMSPATAKALGVDHGTLVRVNCGGREVEIPAYVMPGQAPGTVAVALGYGRAAAGKVGGDAGREVPPVGVDVYPLRTARALHFAADATVTPTGKPYALATTQEHHAIDAAAAAARGRRIGELVREFTLAEYEEESKRDPQFARHAGHLPELESLWEEPKYEGRRWGLTIDLSKCTGCGACMVACQAENNVPVVGKERVLRGRQMHWIRVDRYYRGEGESPRVVQQVVMCHHCENAPCEQVCPVAATVHSKEGLNDMVYNRCVGTRYCSNNCPYKVRRFNFFNYRKDLEEPENEVLKMVYNPEVTIRSRGVMEKCTYCVQRIQAAKIEAKNRREPIRDGQVLTACQQACPAGAIVFGDLGFRDDRGEPSLVAKLRRSARAYEMLAELNVKPRTSYLARIRNPNPELEG